MTPRDYLFLPPPDADSRLAYGAGPLQWGEVRTPKGAGPHPLLVVIHGGFWRNTLDLSHMGRLCAALAAHGIATFNIAYRRMGDDGGGWPGTFDDVRQAAAFARRRWERVGALGFSAGGHLALRLAGECEWLSGVVGLGPVADLVRAWELRLSNGVVGEFIGGRLEELSAACPMSHRPRTRVEIVHGTADDVAPVELSRRYAGVHPCTLAEVEGANHFDVLNPESTAWPAVSAAARRAVA